MEQELKCFSILVPLVETCLKLLISHSGAGTKCFFFFSILDPLMEACPKPLISSSGAGKVFWNWKLKMVPLMEMSNVSEFWKRFPIPAVEKCVVHLQVAYRVGTVGSEWEILAVFFLSKVMSLWPATAVPLQNMSESSLGIKRMLCILLARLSFRKLCSTGALHLWADNLSLASTHCSLQHDCGIHYCGVGYFWRAEGFFYTFALELWG